MKKAIVLIFMLALLLAIGCGAAQAANWDHMECNYWWNWSFSRIGNTLPTNGGYVWFGGTRWKIIGKNDDHWLMIAADNIGEMIPYTQVPAAMAALRDETSGLFSQYERELLEAASKAERGSRYQVEYVSSDGEIVEQYDVNTSAFDNEFLFLMSVSDYFTYPAAQTSGSGRWWTRSQSPDVYERVNENGEWQTYNFQFYFRAYDSFPRFNKDMLLTERMGLRPAVLIRTDQIFYESAAQGGKSEATAGSGAFGHFRASSANGDRKLTVTLPSWAGCSVQIDKTEFYPGEVVNITYSNAIALAGFYVSAVLCDRSGTPVYHASIAPTASNGTWALTMPDDISQYHAGPYTLKVFEELLGGDGITDYASTATSFDVTPICDVNYRIEPENTGTFVLYEDSSCQTVISNVGLPIDTQFYFKFFPNPGYRFDRKEDPGNAGYFIRDGQYVYYDVTCQNHSTHPEQYIAHFKPATYDVTFQNWNGEALQTCTVAYGETPVYTGETPTRPMEPITYGGIQRLCDYEFVGWDSEPSPLVSETQDSFTYTAVFTPLHHVAFCRAWYSEEDPDWTRAETVKEGEIPVYTGETPTRPDDDSYYYTFSGWSPEPEPFNENSPYTFYATFAAHAKWTGSGTEDDPWLVAEDIYRFDLPTGWYEIASDVTASERLNVDGDVHLTLGAGTTLTASQGINVSSGNSLTISGTGVLNAFGCEGCAGIGGGINESCGSVTINSGTVNATGSVWGAGIGGGKGGGNGGNITITGGNVTAQCYNSGNAEVGLGAGIGGGDLGSGGNVLITGGTVYARGNRGSAGIGGGGYGSGGTITVTGGRVTAIGSAYESGRSGAGIGAGRVRNNATSGDSGNITITGGAVIAIGGDNAQAIGISNEVAANDSGTLTLGDGLMVKAGDSESTAVIATGDLIAACRSAWTMVTALLPYCTPDFTLPAFLTAVEAEAFEGAAMRIVLVPAGCLSIGDHAFRNCPNLTQIRIPAGCAIGTDAFDGCDLVYVYGAAGSPAETYCSTHDNCVFVEETQD